MQLQIGSKWSLRRGVVTVMATNFCPANNNGISGEVYCCAKCNFDLHKSCFDAPRELEHGGHPQHTLKLLSKTPYSSGKVMCNGCGKENKGFDYHCASCKYDLHLDCAHLPKVMSRDDHQHTLTLYYSLPHSSYCGEEYCAVCRYAIDDVGSMAVANANFGVTLIVFLVKQHLHGQT
ncbi:hypothetical protein Ancab_025249 [Ancistrocladus abbreviatus]